MTSSRGIMLDEAVSRVVPQGRRVGLVIGIDAYDDASGIPRLTAAVADANAMHSLMVDPACGRFAPDDTKVLTDGTATGANIRIALERLRKKVAEDDEVWFFFAGHALLVDGQHRLLPVDAQRDVLDATSVDFPELFTKIRCRRKIVFLDCCHAGASDASTRNVYEVDEVFKSYPATGTVTYCSSDGDQKSVELPDKGHGAFTYWLERGLRGEADLDGSGVVTSDELWQYVCRHVEEDARRLTGRTQTPRIKTDTSGPFPLSVNIGGVQARQARQEQQDAEMLARRQRVQADKRSLEDLLGADLTTHLSTDEVRAAIKALEDDESGRTAQIVRKALDAFRANGDVDDATLRVRGVLRDVVPSSRPSNTQEIERQVREVLARQRGDTSAAQTPPATPRPDPSGESNDRHNPPAPPPPPPSPRSRSKAPAAIGAAVVAAIAGVLWLGSDRSPVVQEPREQAQVALLGPNAADEPPPASPAEAPVPFDAIVEGVRQIGLDDRAMAGPVAATAPGWVAIASADESLPNPRAFVIARHYESGRVAAFGHNAFLASAVADNALFVSNLFRWLAAGHSARACLAVAHGELNTDSPFLRTTLGTVGIETRVIPQTITPFTISDCGVVVINNAQRGFTQGELQAVREFVVAGKGLLLGGLGWSYAAYSETKNIQDYPMLQVGGLFGVEWPTSYLDEPNPNYKAKGWTRFGSLYPYAKE